jgi:tail assembly chaperone E/41/14-like protein
MSDKNPMTEKIALDFPIQVDGKKLTELDMRRPSVGDQIAATHNATGQAAQEVALFGSLLGLLPIQMNDIDLKDYKKIQEQFQSFLS